MIVTKPASGMGAAAGINRINSFCRLLTEKIFLRNKRSGGKRLLQNTDYSGGIARIAATAVFALGAFAAAAMLPASNAHAQTATLTAGTPASCTSDCEIATGGTATFTLDASGIVYEDTNTSGVEFILDFSDSVGVDTDFSVVNGSRGDFIPGAADGGDGFEGPEFAITMSDVSTGGALADNFDRVRGRLGGPATIRQGMTVTRVVSATGATTGALDGIRVRYTRKSSTANAALDQTYTFTITSKTALDVNDEIAVKVSGFRTFTDVGFGDGTVIAGETATLTYTAAAPAPIVTLLGADGNQSSNTPPVEVTVGATPAEFTLRIENYTYDIDNNDGTNNGFLAINMNVSNATFPGILAQSGVTTVDGGAFTLGFGTATDSSVRFIRGGSTGAIRVLVPKDLLRTSGTPNTLGAEDIVITVTPDVASQSTTLRPTAADAFETVSVTGSPADAISGNDDTISSLLGSIAFSSVAAPVAAAPTITPVTFTGPAPNGVISLILNYAADISGRVTSNPAVTHFVYVGSSGITNAIDSGPVDCAQEAIAANLEIPIGTLTGSCVAFADGPGGEGLTGMGADGATITFRLRNAPGAGGLSEEATLTFAAATASASTATFAAFTAATGGTAIPADDTPLTIPVTEGVPIFQRLTLNGTLGAGERVDLTPDAPVAAGLSNAPDATIADDLTLTSRRGIYFIQTGGSTSAISVEAETDDIVEGPEYFQIGGGDLLYTHGLLTPIPADGLLTYRIVDATTTNATVTLDATTVDEGGTLTAMVTLDSDKMLAEAATFVLERVDATDGSPTQAEDADVSFVTVAVPAGVLGASGAAIVTITDSDGVDPGESFKVGVDLAASTYGNGRSLSDQITSVPSADVAITDADAPAPPGTATFARGNGTIAAGGGTSTFSVALTDIPANVSGTAVAAVGIQLSFGGSTNAAASGNPLTDLDVTLTGTLATGSLITTIGSGGTATYYLNRTAANTLTVTVTTKNGADAGEVFVVNVDDINLRSTADLVEIASGIGVLTDSVAVTTVAEDDRTFTVGPAPPAPTAVLTATSGTEVAANGDPTTFTIVLSNIDANSLSNIGDSRASTPRDSLLLTIALDGTADRSGQVFSDASDPEITVDDFTLGYDIPPGGVIADDSVNNISFNRVIIALSETFFDSPATTKTITFTLKAKSTAGAGDTIIPRIVSVTDGTVMIDPGTNAVTITDGPTTVAAGDIDNNGNSDVPGADTVFTIASAADPTAALTAGSDNTNTSERNNVPGTAILTLPNATEANGIATVDFVLTDSTATRVDDYILSVADSDGDRTITYSTAASGLGTEASPHTFTLPANRLTTGATFTVTPVADGTADTESVVIMVTNVAFATTGGPITDDTAAITIAIADYGTLPTTTVAVRAVGGTDNDITENAGNAGRALFDISFNNQPNGAATVRYTLAVTGDAPASGDISSLFTGNTNVSGSPVIDGDGTDEFTITNASAVTTIIIDAQDDADLTDEVVTFTIESVVFDDDTGTGTDISTAAFATIDILDDDAADPTVKTLAGLVVSAPVAADTILDTPVVPGTTEYRLDVMNTQTSLTFAPTLTDTTNGTFTVTATNVAGTAITVANAEDVASGTSVTVNNLTVNDVAGNTDTNTIVITVIADDDSERPYTFDVAQNADADLCFRTEQVATVILGLISDSACQTATLTRLNDITSNTLNFRGDAITALKAGDFEGLSGVDQIDLRGTTSNSNNIRSVVAETFSGLLKTKAGGTAGDVWIRLNGNDNLATIDANAFMNTDLEALSLGDTALTTLPATLLNHSPDLLNLNLNGVAMGGDLEELPATLLSANTSLEGIRLDENPNLTSLPPGFLDGPLANGNDFDQARLDDALRRQVAITGASNIGMDDTLTLTMEVQNLASTPVAASFPAALRADIVVSDPATGTISGDTTVTVAAGSMTQTFDIILTGGAGTETFNVKLENLAVVSTANDAHASTAIIDADISDGITNTDVAALTATAAADRVITVGAEPPSNDASLADLTAGPTGGTAVAFTTAYSQAAVTNDYEVNLPSGANVTVIADPNDGDAVVTSITGTADGAGNAGTGTPLGGQETTAGAADETITANLTGLVTGRNTIEVLVTAQDNTPRTYTLTATVAAPDGISVSTDTNTLIEGGAAATFTVHFVGVDVSDGNQIRLNLDLPGAGTFTASNTNVLTESNNQWRVTFPTDGQVNGSSFFRLGTAGRIGFNVVGGVGGSNFRLNAGTQDVPIMIEALSTGPGARDAVVQLAGTADVHQSLSRRRQITPSPRGVTYSVEAVADPTDSSLRTATVDGDTVTFSGPPLAGSVSIDNASTTEIIARPGNNGATVFVCTVTDTGTGVGAQLGTGTGTVTVSDAAVPNTVNTFRILVAAVDNSDSIGCTSTDTAVGSATLVTGHTITVNVRPAVVVTPTSVEVMSSATDVTEGGAFNITVTLDAPVAASETVTLPYVFSGTGIATTDFSYTVAGTATTGLTGSLVFAATQQSKVIAVTPTADGTAETGGSETLKFKLTAGPGTTSGYNGVVVEAGDEVDINITDPVALGTITMINSGNNRIEIGRESAEVTLRVNNVFPAAPGAATDFLAVDLDLIAVSGFRDSDRQPPHFNTSSSLGPVGNFNGTFQTLTGTGGINVVLPDNIGTNGIDATNRPFLVRRSSNAFRVIMPRPLFANGTGTQTAANMEDVRIILTPNPATVVAGDTEIGFVGGARSDQAGYYPRSSLNSGTGRLTSDTLLTGESRFEASGAATEINFKLVHPYSSGPLPSTMNPTAQDIVPKPLASSGSYNMDDSAIVTVALPPGITAPAGAVRADVILDLSSTGNTITALTKRTDFTRDRFNIDLDTDDDGNTDGSVVLMTPTFNTTGFIYGSASIPSGGVNDIALRTFVTAGQPLYGEISFSIFGQQTSLADNNVIITATGIQFYDSANAALGSEVVLTDSNALGRVATVNMIAAEPTNVLSSLTVGGNAVPLTVTGTGAGVGIVDNLRVADNQNVTVAIALGLVADSTTVSGTNAEETPAALTVNTATATGDRDVTVSGFTPGFNTLLVTVDPAAAGSNRVYTISVFVPPDRNDSTLASATVNGVAVDFSGDPGTVTISPATMATIVATPVNPEADFYVCAGNGTSGGFLTGDVPVTSANTTDYTIYVVAPVTSADVAVAAPNDCTEAATDVAELNASASTITITVSTASADLSALTVMPSGGSETPIFVANTEHYGVTLADNTTSAVIVATPVADDANIAISVAASGTEDSSGTTIATATCDDTTSGANTCTVSGIDAGETAVVTITVTSGELLNVLTKRYTIAIGPASARLVLSPTAVAPGAAVNLTLQVRNYDRIGAGGFLNAQIFAKEGAVNADIALETNLDITIPSRGTLVADGAEFSFNVSGNTGIAGTGGGYDTTTGGFRLIVPKALLTAGNNSDAASLVNGVNFVVAITAKEDVRIVERRFSLGTVDARLANQDDGRDTTADPIANVDTDAVALGITATTRATLDYPDEFASDNDEGAIRVDPEGTVMAEVSIANPVGGGPLTGIAFRVRTGNDDSANTFLTREDATTTTSLLDFGDLTIAHNNLAALPGATIEPTDTNVAGWTLNVLTVASPIDINLTITLAASADLTSDFYTLELVAADGDNIGTYVYPTRGEGDPANNGRIQVGAIEESIALDATPALDRTARAAVESTVANPTEGNPSNATEGSVPIIVTLARPPTAGISMRYRITAAADDNNHASPVSDDYPGIRCTLVCSSGRAEDFDANYSGSVDPEEVGLSGALSFNLGTFGNDGDGEAANEAKTSITIFPNFDNIIEGTETVEVTLYYLSVDQGTIGLYEPATDTRLEGTFSIDITDRTTSNVTVSLSDTTPDEGTFPLIIADLDDDAAGNPKTIGADTVFSLQRVDASSGPQAQDADIDFPDTDDGTLNAFTMLAETSGFSGEMTIVPDNDNTETENSEKFKVSISGATATTRNIQSQLTFVDSADITIGANAAAFDTDATLSALSASLSAGSAILPNATADLPAGTGGAVDLLAGVTEIVITADPASNTAAITDISAADRDSNALTVVTSATSDLGRRNGAPVTATVSGLLSGINTVTIQVLPASGVGDLQEYTLTVNVGLNTVNTLASLTVTPTTPADDPVTATIDNTARTVTVPLPAGTTAANFVATVTDGNATIGDFESATEAVTNNDLVTIPATTFTDNGTDGTPDMAAVATANNVTNIDNNDSFTFTITSESGVEVTYTVTIIVRDALLASASFTPAGSVTALDATSLGATGTAPDLLGTAIVRSIPANTATGNLVLTLADTDDSITIDAATTTNERGTRLTVTDVSNTNGVRTVTLGNIGIGTSTVTAVVRPAGGRANGNDDRTYTISLIVTPDPDNRVAGITAVGPTTLPTARTGETYTRNTRLNFFARDFNVSAGSTAVTGIRFNLSFTGSGSDDTATGFTETFRDSGVLTNNYYRVTFDRSRHNLVLTGSGNEILVGVVDPAFASDGSVDVPIDIALRARTLGGGNDDDITGGVVSLEDNIDTVRNDGDDIIGARAYAATASPNMQIEYSVVPGPSVTLDAAATATEAGPTNGTLDMVLTHNLGTLDNEPAIVTYTIGGDAVRGANADYTLTVGGVAPANCNASGEGCTYRFSGSANATQTAPVVVMPRDDSVSEDDEMVTITITALSFPNVAQGDQPESIVLPDNASEVTITDNDADVSISAPAASSIAENSETSTTFTVDISSAANSEATITLSLTGATYGGDTGDYTIASSDLGSFMAPDDGDETGDITGTITPSNGTATATFTVTANDDSELSEGEETIRITLTSVTGTDTFARTAPTTRTIAIVDNDVVDTRLCDRTGAATQVILDAVNGVPGVDNRSCDDPPTVAQLGEITELDLREVEVTELEEGVLENLNGVETLMLPVDSSNEPIITTIAPGALDPVLPTLSTLTGFPTDLRNIFSVAAVPGQEGIQQGGTMELLIARSNVRGIPPFVAATIEYELTVPPGAAAGDFTVSEGPTTAGTTAFAASQSTVGPLAIAPNQTNTGTLTFDTNDVMKTVIIEAADGVSLTGEVVFRISEPVIERVMGSISNMIIGLGTTDVTLPVVRATAAPTLSGDVSISEKSEEEGVITLNLGTGTDEGTATVTFSLSNPDGNQMPTTGNPIPRLAASDEDSEGDYTLVIMQDRSPVTLVPPTIASTGNTFTVNRDVSAATFTFTAINDDRKEGNEVVTLTITNVNFTDENAPDYNRPLTADIEITEVGGDAVMRETAMISQAVGKEQVGMTTRLIRQRISGMFSTPSSTSQVSARTDTQAHSLDENGMQISLAENPQTIQDFFSQMALEKSGSMDQGGNYAVWVRGQYVSISGSPAVAGTENFEYDGTIVGVGSGIERRYNNYLVGLSLNYSTADIDSKSDLREQANYKETMNIIAPYAAWQPQNLNLTLWGTAGYGFGSAEISSSDHTTGSPSVSMFFAQGGVNRTVSFGENSSIVLGISALSVSKTVDGYTVDIGPVPELSTDIFQAQADATVYMPVTFGESVVRPYFGIATVHDIGDVQNDDRHAMEGRVGVSWLNGPWSVNLEGFNQFLREDEKAWGVFGEVSWVGTRNFDGLFMGMTGGHGTAASMSDTAAAAADSVSEINTVLSDADSEAAEWSFQTNTEYGFAAPLVHRDGRATPFFRTTHSADARSFESGVRMDMTNNVGITMETNRHIPADDDPYSEHAVGLEARWAF